MVLSEMVYDQYNAHFYVVKKYISPLFLNNTLLQFSVLNWSLILQNTKCIFDIYCCCWKVCPCFNCHACVTKMVCSFNSPWERLSFSLMCSLFTTGVECEFAFIDFLRAQVFSLNLLSYFSESIIRGFFATFLLSIIISLLFPSV